MGEEFRGKVFRSGNSLALRLPKGLGMTEGAELRLVQDAPNSFRAEPVRPAARGIDISGFWGKVPGLTLAPREDFEDRPSGWRPPAMQGDV